MQIVIDIHESDYNDARIRMSICGSELLESANGRFAYSIANGTPLPKGHGRLIDADEVQRRNPKRILAVDAAPTIIEADKDVNNNGQ